MPKEVGYDLLWQTSRSLRGDPTPKTDWERFKEWLTARNPSTFEDSNLHSLSTGFISIAGEDEINCDDSERTGANIQAGMDSKTFTKVRFKRNDQAKPLEWY